MKRLSYIFLSLVIASCTKSSPDLVEEGQGNPIQFSISDQIEMKSSVESFSDLKNNASVYLYAIKNGSDLKEFATKATYKYNYCNKQLLYSSSTGLWDINPGTGEEKAVWECDSTDQHAPLNYQFSAYACCGTDTSGVAHSSFSEFGKTFTATLPETYSDDCGTDYLLSNIYSVSTNWNGSAARGEVVKLHMEHALASVKVKVKVNEKIYKVGIQGIQIKNFYRKATMKCTSQATYGSGNSNQWSTTSPDYNTTDYLFGDVTRGSGNTKTAISACPFIMNKSDASHEMIIMNFIAIPQDASDAVLTIAFLVQEAEGGTGTEYEHQVVSSWNLSSYSGWDSGKRNVYTITIDTSNSLSATIDDWTDGNSITGVILP